MVRCANVQAKGGKLFGRPCGANELMDRIGMRCDRLLRPSGFNEVKLAIDWNDGGNHAVTGSPFGWGEGASLVVKITRQIDNSRFQARDINNVLF